MEPIDSDLEYVVRQRHEGNPRARFNWMYLLPTLGVIWLLFLFASAAFQWPIMGVVAPVMTIMILLFFVAVGLLFWTHAPKENR
jgi:tellurite resistance protein TehA-like permease